MPGRWEFNRVPASSVRVAVTQWDQFNNDDARLAATLVREALQNSLDAAPKNGTVPVKVSFKVKRLNSSEVDMLHGMMESLMPHLDACGLVLSENTTDEVKVLCIEDFNTTGLTGSFEDLDGENFDRFWRAFGESGKSGQQGGRHGLGKLVYPSASRFRFFFGLTIRENDDGPSSMGQAVLANHRIGINCHPAHGFWFSDRSENDLELQLPITDPEEILRFEALCGTNRKGQRGLSLAIPHLIDGITEETILSAVIDNYYFPILAGKLEVELGEEIVNADTFIDIARRIGGTGRIPLSFVKQISDALNSDDYHGAIVPIGASRLKSASVPDKQIQSMKSVFIAGDLVHLRIAVDLKPKGQPRSIGTIDLFLRSCADEEEPFSLFSRGPIILSGEERRSAAGIVALGAMIADSEIVAGFLGDAENAAHTLWSETAEKLTSRWETPHLPLRAIRHSLRDLYDMIAEQREMHDADALIDFFWLVDKSEAARSKPKRVGKPKIEVPPREAGIRINPKNGGFNIVAGPGAEKWRFPRRIRVRIAYDIIGADPFRRFSPFDFDLRKQNNVVFRGDNGDTTIVRANALYFDVNNPDFRLEAAGFDARRDLVVDARAL
ncbi:MAG: hypothetical protein OXC10_04505 [Rhodospirillaceae bacterium]|nr:hypothetical protein [Rhodospirillaceae bacterium]